MEPEISSLEAALALLEPLDLAFLYLEGGAAKYLSARAAKLLAIRERFPLEPNLQLLQPLIESARSFSSTETAELRRRSPAPPLNELILQSADHRSFKAVAVTKPFPVAGRQVSGAMVVFQDLTSLEPFFHTIEQSRRNRAALILGSSLSGRSLLFKPGSTDMVSVYRSVEDSLFKQPPSLDQNVMQTDLQRGISAAVDIVDPLLLPSTKITLDIKTSALIKVGRPNFLRIVCHMLLEAADFVGPFGGCKVTTEFCADGDLTAQGVLGYHAVNLTVAAERSNPLPADASPLELYVYRRFMPASYRVTISESPTAGDSGGNSRRQLMLPDEALSENATIGVQIARQCNVRSEMFLPEPNLLVWTTYLPLYRER